MMVNPQIFIKLDPSFYQLNKNSFSISGTTLRTYYFDAVVLDGKSSDALVN